MDGLGFQWPDDGDRIERLSLMAIGSAVLTHLRNKEAPSRADLIAILMATMAEANPELRPAFERAVHHLLTA